MFPFHFTEPHRAEVPLRVCAGGDLITPSHTFWSQSDLICFSLFLQTMWWKLGNDAAVSQSANTSDFNGSQVAFMQNITRSVGCSSNMELTSFKFWVFNLISESWHIIIEINGKTLICVTLIQSEGFYEKTDSDPRSAAFLFSVQLCEDLTLIVLFSAWKQFLYHTFVPTAMLSPLENVFYTTKRKRITPYYNNLWKSEWMKLVFTSLLDIFCGTTLHPSSDILAFPCCPGVKLRLSVPAACWPVDCLWDSSCDADLI